MFVVETKVLAVVMCVVTMLCWGSWANMQKLASKEWRFQLFYWDYSFGVLLLTLAFALTLGNMGAGGRGFLDDLGQASGKYIGYALLGGVVFNIANILLVAAIDIADVSATPPSSTGTICVLISSSSPACRHWRATFGLATATILSPVTACAWAMALSTPSGTKQPLNFPVSWGG